jgi:hypothetical protein
VAREPLRVWIALTESVNATCSTGVGAWFMFDTLGADGHPPRWR